MARKAREAAGDQDPSCADAAKGHDRSAAMGMATGAAPHLRIDDAFMGLSPRKRARPTDQDHNVAPRALLRAYLR
jgi:hypothetical protein